MSEKLTRRRTLQTVAAGVAVGTAGCSGILGGGGGGPCSTAESYYGAIYGGNADKALQYVPYEYQPGRSEQQARETMDALSSTALSTAAADVSVSCDCAEPLGESEFDQITVDFGDNEITAAQALRVQQTFEAGGASQEVPSPAVAVEVEGDGWYILQGQQVSEKCPTSTPG